MGAGLLGKMDAEIDDADPTSWSRVLDSEGSAVEVGESTIVSENAVLRATASGAADAPVIL